MIPILQIRSPGVKRRWPIVFVVLALQAQSLHGSEIYKWVDGHGTVHYGERPQIKGAEKLTVSTKPVANRGDQERSKHQERLLRVFEEERQEKAAAAQVKRLEKEQRKKNCMLARDQLYDYEHASMLYRKEKLGNRVVLGNDERAETEQGAREAVNYWCD